MFKMWKTSGLMNISECMVMIKSEVENIIIHNRLLDH